MADQNEGNPTPAQESKGRKLPLKTLAIIAAVLLIEGVVISGVFIMAGGPADAKAQTTAVDAAAQARQPVELPVIADKFQNTRSGRPYLYDTEIYIVAQKQYEEQLKDKIATMKAQITTDVATVFRRADPAELLEPSLATLTRQVQSVLNDRLGKDKHGKPYVQEVLIKKCMQFRAGY